MKFLLINVPVREDREPSCFPTGPGIIAQVLLDHGHEVEILDANALRIPLDDVVDRAAASDADAVGVSGLVSTYSYQLRLIRALKERRPARPVIAGGGCATSIPHLMMKNAPVDVLVIGEGEHTIVELLSALEEDAPLGRVAGLVFRDGESWEATPPRALEPDLDRFPMPAYHLFPTERYLNNPVWKVATPAVTLISSRGCPMDCSFCYSLFGQRSYRTRSAARIGEEIRLLRERYGVRFFCFVDDNLTINRKHMNEVCDVMEQERVAWGCHGRVTSADDRRLERLARSGCEFLGFGIESGSQRILDRMNKRVDVRQAGRAIQRTLRHGITANTTYIYGYPGEDEESIRETMRFKLDNNQDTFGFFATPYPGTRLYDEARERGLIEDEHAFVLSLNNAYDFTINLTDMSDERLKELACQSKREMEIALTFKLQDPEPPQVKDYLSKASELLSREFLLPDVKGYIMLGMSRLFLRQGQTSLAARTAAVARRQLKLAA